MEHLQVAKKLRRPTERTLRCSAHLSFLVTQKCATPVAEVKLCLSVYRTSGDCGYAATVGTAKSYSNTTICSLADVQPYWAEPRGVHVHEQNHPNGSHRTCYALQAVLAVDLYSLASKVND